MEEEISSIDQSKIKKQALYIHNANIKRENIKRIMKELHTISLTPMNKFELQYEPKSLVDNWFDSFVLLSNRCSVNKEVFLIFEEIHEILELQMLLEEEILIMIDSY